MDKSPYLYANMTKKQLDIEVLKLQLKVALDTLDAIQKIEVLSEQGERRIRATFIEIEQLGNGG